MLILSSSFENVKTWLLSSGLLISDTKDENCGAVHSFYDGKKKEYGFLYTEITGYYLSALRFLYEIEKSEKYVEYSRLSADWLVGIYDKYGGIIQGLSTDQSKQELVYSFDTAVCAKGLMDNFVMTGDEKYLKYAKKMVTCLVDEALDDDGSVRPFKNLNTNEFTESNDVWYKQKGCFHIKTAIPILQLYQITKDKRLLEYAIRICDTYSNFQNSDGSFSLHRNNRIINLHTQCYALEGLLYAYIATKNTKYFESCNKALLWCAKKIGSDGSIDLWFNTKFKSKSSYAIAQVIRLMVLSDKINKNNNSKKYVNKLYSFLISLQALNPDPKINGAFIEEFYKSIFGWKKRQKLNSWASMFALQALYWFDNYEKITFEEAIEYLY